MEEIKTKDKVLNIARTLFWKNGYHATSMRDLAREYGCKPANIYNFFPNKEEILYEVLLEEMEQIIEPIKHLEEDEDTDPIQQLRIIIESHLAVTLSYRRSAKTLFDVSLDNLSPPKRKEIVDFRDTYDRIIRKTIQRGIDSGLFPRTNAKLASFMIASMITRTRIWFHPRKGVSAAELAEFIFQFALNGLKGGEASSI
jgi:AcrR family transcriptional regulator